MSGWAMKWAKGQKVGKGRKNLLLLLAYRANDAGFAWPPIRELVADSELGERHIKRVLQDFIDTGILVAYYVIDRSNGSQRATVYWFPIDAAAPTLAELNAYEIQTGGLLVRRMPKGSDVANVTPPPGDSGVMGGVTRESSGGVTPESPLKEQQDSTTIEPTTGAGGRTEFLEALAAWPMLGRKTSSQREAWAAWSAEVARGANVLRMLAAAKAYAADRDAWGSSGRPLAFHNFWARGRWESFAADLAGDASPGPLFAGPEPFVGPDAVVAVLKAGLGEAGFASWTAGARWSEAERKILTRTAMAVERIESRCRLGLRDLDVKVEHGSAMAAE